MPNTINIVQPKAEDGVTEVSFVTRTNSIYKSDGSPLGDSLDAYMDEVDELSQNLTELQTVHTTELTSTYISTGIKIWRCGKMARMTILGIKNLPTGQTNIATIPEGYRPYEVDAFTKDLLDSNLSPKLRVFCDATGTYLRMYNYTGAALTLTNLQIETEYFTQ